MSKIAEILVLIVELQAKLADVDAFVAAEKAASFDAGKLLGLEEGKKLGFDEGFAAGVASVPVGPGGFTQEQVDAMILAAIEPLQKKIEVLQLVVDGVQAQIDQKVAEALIAFKAELLVKVQEVDSIEDAALAELLK